MMSLVRVSAMVSLVLALSGFQDNPTRGIKREVLPDGVERWVNESADDRPAFLREFERRAETKVGRFPFGRSIAFLAGVSRYRHL